VSELLFYGKNHTFSYSYSTVTVSRKHCNYLTIITPTHNSFVYQFMHTLIHFTTNLVYDFSRQHIHLEMKV